MIYLYDTIDNKANNQLFIIDSTSPFFNIIGNFVTPKFVTVILLYR